MTKEVWDSLWKEPKFSAKHVTVDTEVLKILEKHVSKFKPRSKIIEVGSGVGGSTLTLAKKYNLKPFLLDYSSEALKISQKVAKNLKIKPELIQADCRKIPLKGNTFDVVWNGGVIEHFKGKELQKVFDEMFRICKPGGVLAVFIPNPKCVTYRVGKFLKEKTGLWRWGYEKSFDTDKLLNLMKKTKILEKGELNNLDALFYFPLVYEIFRKLKKKIRFSDSKFPLVFGIHGTQIYAIGKKIK